MMAEKIMAKMMAKSCHQFDKNDDKKNDDKKMIKIDYEDLEAEQSALASMKRREACRRKSAKFNGPTLSKEARLEILKRNLAKGRAVQGKHKGCSTIYIEPKYDE